MAASEEPSKRRNPQERPRRIQDRIYDRLFHNYIWQSVFRSGYPSTPRNQMLAIATNIFLHLHPTRLHRTHVKIPYTYCLGGLAFFMFLILTVTGILLMFYYVPSTDRAYTDIAALETNVEFGLLMRNLHRWTGHAMVILVFLHMMRVFYTGAYKPPHEFNWVVGVILLVLTLLLSFTGYLLPWDQLALWAVTVGTNMVGSAPYLGDDVRLVLLGGYEVGEGALIRFYTLHVLALPLLAAIFMAVHFWRIRRDGGMAEPL
jgi:quinol-cytochrome oxidoreductase complex cytochrome b subunit